MKAFMITASLMSALIQTSAIAEQSLNSQIADNIEAQKNSSPLADPRPDSYVFKNQAIKEPMLTDDSLEGVRYNLETHSFTRFDEVPYFNFQFD